MLFDINAYLGAFALRELRHNDVAGLSAFMERKGIRRALVSAAEAITWKDCHSANRLLSERLAGTDGNIVPCAVINPGYAGWRRDLEEASCGMGMRAVKLYPHWHGYSLGDGCADEVVRAATDLGLPVLIPVRAVDRRQLGWLFDVPDVPLADIAALAGRHPDARFVVLNGLGFTGSPLAAPEGERPSNCWIEISRLPLFISRELPVLLEVLGASRLLFGTGMPFKYPDPVLLKMDKLGASRSETRAICGENAAELLGLA
jgi:hypothetical protein